MERNDETMTELIAKLTSLDYGVRLMALGRLIEAGEVAVPGLLAALKRPDDLLKACAACALAGIGTPQAARPLVQLWEEAPLDPSRIEALVELATRFSRWPTAADIPALVGLLSCYKSTVAMEKARNSSETGHLVSALAAEGLSKLARTAPTPALRAALPLLKRDIWNSSPEEFSDVRALIEDATQQWKDLPVTASGPMHTVDLPRPASANETERK